MPAPARVPVAPAQTPAELRAEFLAKLRAVLEPQAAAELEARKPAAAAALTQAEAELAAHRAALAPLRERLACLESRIADAAPDIPIPDIEAASTADYLAARTADAHRRIVLPLLRERFDHITNESTPLVQNIRQAEAAVKAERRALAELEAAIAAPFDSALGLETAAGMQWRAHAGTGDAVRDARKSPPEDPRIRRRKDGTVLALVNPREITPEQAAHQPSAHPAWGTTRGPAGDAGAPGRIPDDVQLGPGIPGARANGQAAAPGHRAAARPEARHRKRGESPVPVPGVPRLRAGESGQVRGQVQETARPGGPAAIPGRAPRPGHGRRGPQVGGGGPGRLRDRVQGAARPVRLGSGAFPGGLLRPAEAPGSPHGRLRPAPPLWRLAVLRGLRQRPLARLERTRMPSSFYQVAVGTAPTLLATLPPAYVLQITPAGGTIFLGSATVTPQTGAHCVATVPWQLSGFPTQRPTGLYACTGGGTISAGIALSSPQ
jgi:hypothetical protein